MQLWAYHCQSRRVLYSLVSVLTVKGDLLKPMGIKRLIRSILLICNTFNGHYLGVKSEADDGIAAFSGVYQMHQV